MSNPLPFTVNGTTPSSRGDQTDDAVIQAQALTPSGRDITNALVCACDADRVRHHRWKSGSFRYWLARPAARGRCRRPCGRWAACSCWDALDPDDRRQTHRTCRCLDCHHFNHASPVPLPAWVGGVLLDVALAPLLLHVSIHAISALTLCTRRLFNGCVAFMRALLLRRHR
jgi:hypothetical protein